MLRVKDSLILFKLAAFGDQLIFLFGLHLLSRLLYRHRTTCFIICLSGIGSVVWTWQFYWGLRLFYLLPLALYLYFRFFAERLSWAFWAAILTLLLVMSGGLPYWAPVYIYLFLVMTLIMLPGNWRAFGVLHRPGWKAGLLALVVVFFAADLGYLLTSCLKGLHNYSQGRTEDGMHTTLRTFMAYITPGWQHMHTFLDGTMPNFAALLGYPDDQNPYVGLLPIGALVSALIYVRDRRFSCLVGGLVAILLLAGSGISSWVLYWLIPGMKTFRHLGLLLDLAKVLLLLSAGFGLDLLILRLEIRGWLEENFRPFTLLFFLAGLLLILDMVVSVMAYNPESWTTQMQFTNMLPKGGEWIVVRLAVWGAILTAVFACVRLSPLKKIVSPRVAIGLLVIASLIDIGTFQCYHWLNRNHGNYMGRLELEPLNYSHARTWSVSRPDVSQKSAVIASSPGGASHGFFANILQTDPCAPIGQVDLISGGVNELLAARGAHPDPAQSITSTFFPHNDSKLLTIMGCNASKLRFVTQAAYGRTSQEIIDLLRSSTTLDTTVILKGNQGQQPGSPLSDLSAMTYRPTFFNANRLDLDISVKPGNSGWLVYADAYDPNWKAYVNGNEKPVLEAYRAFKAITIEGGDSKVSFRYENKLQKYELGLLMVVGILFAFSCITGLVWQLFNVRKGKA
jgi:hypothetical protein